jgi:EAL domain-containing protein (putative c-di-GMP-specific phosphodiesterase class I)
VADTPRFPPVSIGSFAEAMRMGQLSLVYQPKVLIGSNEICGVEALARWHDPLRGDIPPDVFIPLVEAHELIHPFTEWVIATAAADWAAWHRLGLTTCIAVNVSARNLGRIDFPDMVARTCEAHGMPCDHLTVELTESATQDLIHLLDTLARLRIKRIGVSLDDFGKGYSSLVRLKQLPFSEVKIDRQFVTNVDVTKAGRVIMRNTINLAHDLGLRVVAEGVETAPVSRILAEFGCDLGQGFYFAQPMSSAVLREWATL